MNFWRTYCLTLATVSMFLFCPQPATAQDSAGDNEDNPLFGSHDLLTVRIEAPLRTLTRKRPDEEYLDGKFSYALADGTEQSLDLKIRTRGKYRRQKKTCSLPPIRLNFRKGQVAGTEFAGQDKLKLVTHCKSGSSSYEQMVLKEYLAYRILQELTDKSFGARLMQITYVDTEGKEKTDTRYGFVIEDDDDIAARLGMELLEIPKTSYSAFEPRHTNLLNLFAYLIGNTDFSMIRGPANDDCCHNNVLYRDTAGMIWPIPYDFDFSGLVNAPYAEPNPQFDIRSVRTRVYRGRCDNNDYVYENVPIIAEKESAIRSLVDSIPGLEPRYQKDAGNYLEQFFEIIKDSQRVEKTIINRCS